MKLTPTERLSVLACGSGIALVAIYFAVVGSGQPSPDWLPMAAAAIAGFELFMVLDSLRNRRVGGGANG